MISRGLLLSFLAPLTLLLNQPAAATTAASLSDRITIDGDLSDWAADEWVLDVNSTLAEFDDDSRWGESEEILRVGITWDAEFLYVAVEFRAGSGSVLAGIGYGPGGLSTLDGAGTFRRAIDFPFGLNILALASARDVPSVAHVDDRAVLVLVDRAHAPAAVRTPLGGPSGFELALPWSLLSLEQALQFTLALTGDEGTGAGDAAPDPSVALPASNGPSSKTRASLDRWLAIPADGNDDGVADAGISPRTVVTVRTDTDFPNARNDDIETTLTVTPRTFAPDQGEAATFTVGVSGAGTTDELFVSTRVYSLDGRLVRTLYQDAARDIVGGALAASSSDRWDGRDDGGRVVPGGVYVIALEWGLVRGEHAGRATAGVAVAR